ncbi:MAG: hypothetical protein ACLPN6_09885 [Streptosporangiaceae bacterium]|jgi:hypothetical protein|nr:hypothetical protein [Actinomycetota bacterium]
MTSAQERPAAVGQADETDQDYAARAAAYEEATGYPLDERKARKVTEEAGGAGAWAGSMLAGVLMIISGLCGVLGGIAALARKQYFVASTSYEFHWSISGWGWTLLILGIVLCLAGVGVFFGMAWARVAGVILAVFSVVANFLFIPYYPVWSIILIAVDVFIIWALMASGRRQRA